MKFNCGLTKQEKKDAELALHQAKQKWHIHFAKWPTQVGSGDCRWLEDIWVRYEYNYFYGNKAVIVPKVHYRAFENRPEGATDVRI